MSAARLPSCTAPASGPRAQARTVERPCTFGCPRLADRMFALHGLSLPCREPRAFDQGAELGPRELRMNAPAHAAVCAGDDVLRADHTHVAADALGNQLRVLDQVGR